MIARHCRQALLPRSRRQHWRWASGEAGDVGVGLGDAEAATAARGGGRLAAMRAALEGGPGLGDFVGHGEGPDLVRTLSPPPATPLAGEAVEQPLTDSFGRFHSYLRISLTEKCNLRCVYCMPPEGVPLQAEDKLLTVDEIERLVRLFRGAGVNKIRLTGGEPLVRKDVADIVRSISAGSEGEGGQRVMSVGVTTNGLLLPRKLPTLVDAGLTHANISLDTLDAARFAAMTRRNGERGLPRVLEAIERAAASPELQSVKVNCVVMRGVNDREMAEFMFRFKDVNVDVRFIEWMPFADNGWGMEKFISYTDMIAQLAEQDGLHLVADSVATGCAPNPHDTTKWFRLEGMRGRVGFITSMSEHFCGGCNRLRITADGHLKVCLFGDESLSLRDAMRSGYSDDEIMALVAQAVQGKRFALGGNKDMMDLAEQPNRPMILIGG